MIKKILTLGLILSTTLSYSQVELRMHSGTTLINGTTITVNGWKGTSNSVDIPVEIDAKSTYSSTKTIKVKKIELSSTAPTSKNAICWGVCTIGELWNNSPILLSDPIPVNAGQTVLYSAHVYPYLTHGTSKFRYVWFDVANPTDSTWVDVIFNISEFVSVKKIEKEDISLKIFPNPATTKLNINLKIKSTTNSTKKLVIRDLIGKIILTKELKSSTINTEINTSEFMAGIYFVSILSNDKAIKTEKIVITK